MLQQQHKIVKNLIENFCCHNSFHSCVIFSVCANKIDMRKIILQWGEILLKEQGIMYINTLKGFLPIHSFTYRHHQFSS